MEVSRSAKYVEATIKAGITNEQRWVPQVNFWNR